MPSCAVDFENFSLAFFLSTGLSGGLHWPPREVSDPAYINQCIGSPYLTVKTQRGACDLNQFNQRDSQELYRISWKRGGDREALRPEKLTAMGLTMEGRQKVEEAEVRDGEKQSPGDTTGAPSSNSPTYASHF